MDLHLITCVSGDTAFIAVVRGYNEERMTFSSIDRTSVKVADMLDGLKENNKYGIRMAEEKLDILKGKINGRSNKTAKCYRIPIWGILETVTYEEVARVLGDNVLTGPSSYAGICRAGDIDVARLYCVTHYARDGKECWYYDANGGKTTNRFMAAVGSSRDAYNIRMYKVRYDGATFIEKFVEEI